MGIELPKLENMSPCECSRYQVSVPAWAKTARVACTDCGTVYGYVSVDALYDIPGLEPNLESGYPYLEIHIAAKQLPALQASEPVRGEPRT